MKGRTPPPSKIQAIETHYRGYRFRSRLEAGWAVFFDTLGVEWFYEYQGYEYDGYRYLPDFFLPMVNWTIEIKGQAPTADEMVKAWKLACRINTPVLVAWGNIGDATPGTVCWGAGPEDGTGYGGQFIWGDCPICNQLCVVGLVNRSRLPTWCVNPDCRVQPFLKLKPGSVFEFPRVRAAFDAARGARFEFGESGR